MRISKKILAIALSILMAVSMMPFTAFADALPTCEVTEIAAPEGLDVAYKYVANDDGSSSYDSYIADFVISFDQAVNAGDVKLGGAYDAYENGAWQIFDCPALAAGEEYRLLQDGVSALLGRDVSMTYDEIKNTVQEFRCGVAGLDAAGVTMTVKLNLYETADSEPIEIESGTKEYTFDALPTCEVTEIAAPEGLDVAYKYVANNDGAAKYDSYLADFVISFDQAVEAGDVKLGGAYDSYEGGAWQIFDCPALAAGQEYRLLQEGVSALLGRDVSMTYAEIKDTVQEFRCGASGIDGLTVNVKLNLYDPATGDAIEIESGSMEYTFEEDVLPTVNVEEIAAPEGLDKAYEYTVATDGSAKYDDYLADFVISFDQAVEAGDVKLGGAYDAYENGAWQIFDCPALGAGEEYKLLEDGVSALLGRDVSMTYAEIRDVVQSFKCGVAGLDAAGVTMTVKLNLYDPETGDAIEIVSGTKEYTFDEDVLPTVNVDEIAAPEGLEAAYEYTVATDGSPKYDDYLVDFVISFDEAVDAGEFKLGGAYDSYEGGAWQIFDCPALGAGEEYKLVEEGVSALLGRPVSMTYAEIRDVVQSFKCGVADVYGSGKKMTVKLNLYDPETGDAIEIVSGTQEYEHVEINDQFDIWVQDTYDFDLYIQDSRAEKVVFEYNGSPEQEANTRVTETVTKEEAEAYDRIFFCSIKLAPAQAYDEVKYTVYGENDEVIRSNTTSAAEYLNAIINDPYYNNPDWDWAVNYLTLAKALYDYSKAAAEYFNYNAAAYTTDYYYSGMNVPSGSETFTETDTTGKVDKVSYLATTEPGIRFTMKDLTKEEADALTVTCDDATAYFATRGDDIVLEVKDIPLSKLHNLLVIDLGDAGYILYTPYKYARDAANTSGALARLGKSIYNANKAAAAYFE